MAGCLAFLIAFMAAAVFVRSIAYPNRLLEFAIGTGLIALAFVVRFTVQWVREGWEASGGIFVFIQFLVWTIPLQLLGGLVILFFTEVVGWVFL